MKRTTKIFFTGLLALTMILGSAGMVYAVVTINATTVSSDGALTLAGATASTFSTTAGAVTIQSGDGAINLTAATTVAVTGNLTVSNNTTLGDAVTDTAILNGRVSTGSVAGADLTIDSTYTYGEGQEYRYNITNWTGVGSTFNGAYLRTQNGVAGSTKNVRGMELYGVANNVDTGAVWGLLSYGYVKGTTAKTVGPVYGIQTELTFDASSSTNTITTEATPLLVKITGGVVDDYTKIQGLIVRSGDMDGASRTYGNAILVEDDTDMAGTITWTRGLKLSSPSTFDIELQNGATIDNATNGVIALSGFLVRSITVAVAAAGNSQSTATALTSDINNVTSSTATSADGVKLPTAVAGMDITVINDTGATIEVFPATDAAINAEGTDAEYDVPTLVEVRCIAISVTEWECQKMSR